MQNISKLSAIGVYVCGTGSDSLQLHTTRLMGMPHYSI